MNEMYLICPICGHDIKSKKNSTCPFCGIKIVISNTKKIKYFDAEKIIIVIEK